MNRSKDCWITVLILVSLGWLTSAYAQITPSADSYTNTATPTTNYGAKTLLDVDGATQTTYIQFDLASIPSSASISQATLKLYVNAVTTAGSFNVDYINGTWAENTITSSLAPALGTTIVSSVALTTADKNQYILINITPALQAWLSGSQSNDGIALVANGTFNATFDSKENTTTSHPPELDVVFASDGTITGVTTASGSGLSGGGTSGTLNLALTNSCAANQVLQWNGSAWMCAAVGTGTVTGVTAGTDLTGGGSGGTLTLNLDTTKVPQLNAANVFAGNQTVNGNIGATGTVTGAIVNSSGGFDLGGVAFAFGSNSNGSVFLGFSGNATSTGARNAATGSAALLSNTTGSDNTAIGYGALLFNTTGSPNTALGSAALGSNSTGGANTATGYGTLQNNSTGSYNTADGHEALIDNTTGADNTAIGDQALTGNTTGNWNTAVGAQAGDLNSAQPTTGSFNTFVGANSNPGTQTNLSNATAIGANAVVSENNALVLGNAVNVGIGTSTPAYTLDVNGTGRFTGLVTFAGAQTFPGAGTITGVSGTSGITGGGTSGSVTLGLAANSCAGGNAITALPFTCSPFATLGANAFAGNQSITGNLTDTGTVSGGTLTSNGAVNATTDFSLGGAELLYGSNNNANVFLGFGNSGISVAGSFNTAVGGDNMYSLTTGSSNSAFGDAALVAPLAGSNNTAIGVAALSGTSSSNNTGVGVEAGQVNQTGQYNTYLGAYAGALAGNSTNLVYAAAIGANSIVSTSNAMALGLAGAVNSNAPNGQVNVGIGTATPAYRLDVSYGDVIVRGISDFSGSTPVANLYVGDSAHEIQAVGGVGIGLGAYSSLNTLVITDNFSGGNGCQYGYVGIRTTCPKNLLTLVQGGGNAMADGWSTYSSRRWKTNIRPLMGALGKVEQLRGVSYELKESGKHEIGVIAEEVGAVIPEVVSYEENGKDARGVDYSRLTALLIEAVKQQQCQIRAQQKQIRGQQSAIARLNGKVGILEATARTVARRRQVDLAAMSKAH